jgi:hypothetical protein
MNVRKCLHYVCYFRRLGNVVGMWTRLSTGRSGVRFEARARDLSLQMLQIGSGVHPATYSMGTGVLSLEVRRQGRDVDHLPPSSVEVKNESSCTFITPICLHGVDRDNFTIFTFSVIILDYITSSYRTTDEFEIS